MRKVAIKSETFYKQRKGAVVVSIMVSSIPTVVMFAAHYSIKKTKIHDNDISQKTSLRLTYRYPSDEEL